MEPQHRLCRSHRIRDVAYMAKPRGVLDMDSPHPVVRSEAPRFNWERLFAVPIFWGGMRRGCSANRVYQLVCVRRTFCSQRLLFPRRLRCLILLQCPTPSRPSRTAFANRLTVEKSPLHQLSSDSRLVQTSGPFRHGKIEGWTCLFPCSANLRPSRPLCSGDTFATGSGQFAPWLQACCASFSDSVACLGT